MKVRYLIQLQVEGQLSKDEQDDISSEVMSAVGSVLCDSRRGDSGMVSAKFVVLDDLAHHFGGPSDG